MMYERRQLMIEIEGVQAMAYAWCFHIVRKNE